MRKSKNYLPKLLEYIELANKIPDGYSFLTYDEIIKLTFDRNNGVASSEMIIEIYRYLTSEFPPDLYEYLFTFDSRVKSIRGDQFDDEFNRTDCIRTKYDLLSSINHAIWTLAYAVTEEFFANESISDNIQGIENYNSGFNTTLPSAVSVNEDGYVELKTTELFDFIATYKIEARRIRLCRICYKIFWANRMDKWTCSKECGNKLRQRNWQLENKEEYNEKRRENYAYKQNMKNKKEKKNGNLQTRQNLVDEFQLQRKARPKKHEN